MLYCEAKYGMIATDISKTETVRNVFIIYNFYVHSYIGIFNESLSLISLIIFYIKEIKNDRRKKL